MNASMNAPNMDDGEHTRIHGGRRHPRITLYRIVVVFLTAGFGLFKAWLSYRGFSTAPNTLDWLSGVVIFLTIYWLGIYEKHAMHNMQWFFETDYLAVVGQRLSINRGVPRRQGSLRVRDA